MRARSTLMHAIAHGARRVRALRGLPVLELLVLAELALAAHKHLKRLDPAERRRLAELARRSRGLSLTERLELASLLAKLELREFAGSAVELISPIPLPKRLTRLVRGEAAKSK